MERVPPPVVDTLLCSWEQLHRGHPPKEFRDLAWVKELVELSIPTPL